jgi:hypothetical protein
MRRKYFKGKSKDIEGRIFQSNLGDNIYFFCLLFIILMENDDEKKVDIKKSINPISYYQFMHIFPKSSLYYGTS